MSSVYIEVRDAKVVRVQSGDSLFPSKSHVTHVLLVSILAIYTTRNIGDQLRRMTI